MQAIGQLLLPEPSWLSSLRARWGRAQFSRPGASFHSSSTGASLCLSPLKPWAWHCLLGEEELKGVSMATPGPAPSEVFRRINYMPASKTYCGGKKRPWQQPGCLCPSLPVIAPELETEPNLDFGGQGRGQNEEAATTPLLRPRDVCKLGCMCGLCRGEGYAGAGENFASKSQFLLSGLLCMGNAGVPPSSPQPPKGILE